MLSFLASRPGTLVSSEQIREVYNRKRWQALFGIFIGYAAYYILRNNFLLSSPELVRDLASPSRILAMSPPRCSLFTASARG